ncbi:MAG: hypothetical protein AAF567_05430 [Actinomycetota bacterium]
MTRRRWRPILAIGAVATALLAQLTPLGPFASPASAQEIGTFTLATDLIEAAVGDVVEVRLVLESVAADDNPAAIEATIGWDSAGVSVQDCTTGPTLGSCNLEASTAQIAVVTLNDFVEGAVIATLDVRVLQPGFHPVNIIAATGYDMSGAPLDARGRSGRILTGSAEVSGDVNCSGTMDVVDALAIAQWSVGLRTDGQQCPLVSAALQLQVDEGDLNADGDTDIVDALLIARCVVGLTGQVVCPGDAASMPALEILESNHLAPSGAGDICLEGEPLSDTCVEFRNDSCEGVVCLTGGEAAGFACPVPLIDEGCVERMPADVRPASCITGSRGEPGDCHIFVAKGPAAAPGAGARCPTQSIEQADGNCKRLVPDAPPLYYCEDRVADLVLVNGDYVCDTLLAHAPAPCPSAALPTVLIEGRCWAVDDGALPAASCAALGALDNGQCLNPLARLSASDCAPGTELRDDACVIVDPNGFGGGIFHCWYQANSHWGEHWGGYGDGCLYMLPALIADCDAAYSWDDSQGGVCARYEFKTTQPDGSLGCTDPSAIPVRDTCVFTADYSAFECPSGYEQWRTAALCSIVFPGYNQYVCDSGIQDPRPAPPVVDPPPPPIIVPTCYLPFGPQPGTCTGYELDGDCFLLEGPFARCDHVGPCLETFVGVAPVGFDDRGDVNCNGAVDQGDVFLFLRHVTGQLDAQPGSCGDVDPFAPFLAAAGDLDENRRIDLLDAWIAAQCSAAPEAC